MSQVKICPSCGLENPLTETLCSRCMADISGVSPIDPGVFAEAAAPVPETVPNASATVIEKKKRLRFESVDGEGSFSAGSGAVIGREAEGQECLGNSMTVSRRHARLNYNDRWGIEDMNSTNGTWVNERRLEPGELCPINVNDRVAFSRSCAFIVKE